MVENGHYVKRVQKKGESKEIKHSPFGVSFFNTRHVYPGSVLTPLQKWTCKR